MRTSCHLAQSFKHKLSLLRFWIRSGITNSSKIREMRTNCQFGLSFRHWFGQYIRRTDQGSVTGFFERWQDIICLTKRLNSSSFTKRSCQICVYLIRLRIFYESQPWFIPTATMRKRLPSCLPILTFACFVNNDDACAHGHYSAFIGFEKPVSACASRMDGIRTA